MHARALMHTHIHRLYLCDLSAFMIATDQGYSIWVPDLGVGLGVGCVESWGWVCLYAAIWSGYRIWVMGTGFVGELVVEGEGEFKPKTK